MGFAGVAAKADIKSVLASLWSVGDESTLALMATALQGAQVALLRQQITLRDGEWRRQGQQRGLPLPSSSGGEQYFSHPHNWAAFTLVGNPW